LPSVSFRCCPVFQFPAGFPNGGVNRFLIQWVQDPDGKLDSGSAKICLSRIIQIVIISPSVSNYGYPNLTNSKTWQEVEIKDLNLGDINRYVENM
jgi:hypothetical protein